MKPEDYFKPRYIVLADWPNTNYRVGDVINDPSFHVDFFDRYPHLFRLLKWYECRSANDMPKYVMQVDNGFIHKVFQWYLVINGSWTCDIKVGFLFINNIHPATLEQYETKGIL